MKYYMRYLLIAVFCGAFCVLGSLNGSSTVLCSDVILMFGFGKVEYFFPFISAITYWFIPVLFFQIFYGTYIYRHFCSASVYFFSRYCNRTGWLLKESLKLYLFSLMYLMLYLLSGIGVMSVFSTVTFDRDALLIGGYYLLIYSLFLFASTLAVNILAIVFTSNVGFILIESIFLSGILLYIFTGEYFITPEELVDQYAWLLKINPFSHLVFNIHSSTIDRINRIINTKAISFDLNISVMVYFIAAVLLMIVGCLVVNRHNFIVSNKETGGL